MVVIARAQKRDRAFRVDVLTRQQRHLALDGEFRHRGANLFESTRGALAQMSGNIGKQFIDARGSDSLQHGSAIRFGEGKIRHGLKV